MQWYYSKWWLKRSRPVIWFASRAVVQETPQAEPRPLTCVLEVLPHPAVQLQPEAPEVDVSVDVSLCLRPWPCLPLQLHLPLLHPFSCQCHQSIQLKRPLGWSVHWGDTQSRKKRNFKSIWHRFYVICYKIWLTNRVMSRSRLCQHMEQRGIVGKGSHIQGDQALFAHPVHPPLPLPLPVLLFLLSSLPHASSSSSSSAVGVVSGQQALYSQSVLIFHRLPQGLVLIGSRKEGAGSKEGGQVREKDRRREFVLKERLISWGRGRRVAVQRKREGMRQDT